MHKVFISYIFIVSISSSPKASFLRDNCTAKLDSSNLAPNQLLYHPYHRLPNVIHQLQFKIKQKMNRKSVFLLVHFLSLILLLQEAMLQTGQIFTAVRRVPLN